MKAANSVVAALIDAAHRLNDVYSNLNDSNLHNLRCKSSKNRVKSSKIMHNRDNSRERRKNNEMLRSRDRRRSTDRSSAKSERSRSRSR